MIKYYLMIVCFVMLVMGWSGAMASSIKDTMTAWELANTMDGSSMTQGDRIPAALQILSSGCQLSTRSQQWVHATVRGTLISIGLTLNKDTAHRYYVVYQQRHKTAQTYRGVGQYCMYKMAAYQLQYRFYQVGNGTALPLNPVHSDATYRTKYFAALDELKNRYPMPSALSGVLLIRVSNHAEVLRMHPISRQTVVKMSDMYRGIIGQALYRLYADGIISQQDMNTIGSRVVFQYVQQCSQIRGLTRVNLTQTRSGRILNAQLINMIFNVNICEDMSYLDGFDDLLFDLAYHELAHYIYYIKDTNTRNFEKLCRNAGVLGGCTRRDFTSDYGMTSPEEDYAEVFQEWYQKQITPQPTTMLGQKFGYFETLFR